MSYGFSPSLETEESLPLSFAESSSSQPEGSNSSSVLLPSLLVDVEDLSFAGLGDPLDGNNWTFCSSVDDYTFGNEDTGRYIDIRKLRELQ